MVVPFGRPNIFLRGGHDGSEELEEEQDGCGENSPEAGWGEEEDDELGEEEDDELGDWGEEHDSSEDTTATFLGSTESLHSSLPPATHVIVQEIKVEPLKYAAHLRHDLGNIAIRDFSIILSFCNSNLIG